MEYVSKNIHSHFSYILIFSYSHFLSIFITKSKALPHMVNLYQTGLKDCVNYELNLKCYDNCHGRIRLASQELEHWPNSLFHFLHMVLPASENSPPSSVILLSWEILSFLHTSPCSRFCSLLLSSQELANRASL